MIKPTGLSAIDIGGAAATIKETVSMEDVISVYGYKIGKGGFIVCPFHGDKDASLKVYRNRDGHQGWHCFGCGRGGSVIDFVMEHENCDFVTAVKAIDQVMNLGLLKRRDMFEMMARRRTQEQLDRIRDSFMALLDSQYRLTEFKLDQYYSELQRLEDTPRESLTADEWTELLTLEEEMQYTTYLQEKITELRRKVTTWRNRARK